MRRAALGGLVCLALALLAVKPFAPREPVCKGKRLSAWLTEMDGVVKSPESYAAASAAVQPGRGGGIDDDEWCSSRGRWRDVRRS